MPELNIKEEGYLDMETEDAQEESTMMEAETGATLLQAGGTKDSGVTRNWERQGRAAPQTPQREHSPADTPQFQLSSCQD